MDKAEFETELHRDGYRVVNIGVKPNLVAPNHFMTSTPRRGFWVVKSPSPVTTPQSPFVQANASRYPRVACMLSMLVRRVLPYCQADAATAARSRLTHLKAT